MKVLIACEESQEVCRAFRAKGHEAFSCDIVECSGGFPEYHIRQDVLNILSPIDHENNYLSAIQFTTSDGKFHEIDKWDLIIAHPPCTYLSNVATRHFSLKCSTPEKIISRWENRALAAVFL